MQKRGLEWLFRLVQEAFNNVVRHANATSISVRVWTRKNTLYCTITDDGVGFDPKEDRPAGLGLLGIRERIGALHGAMTVRSAPGKGTQIHLSIPLTADR
jgi:two-component system, NarL family, sensor histidine kinase DegS